MKSPLLAPLAAALLLTGCSTVYYNAWESVGVHKRDLLVDNVQDARDIQQKTKEQFQTTLERFSEVVAFDGGDLEKKYDKLSKEFERCETRANDVHKHIRDVEDVSKALFKEWKAELKQYTSDDLRRSSERKLRDTEDRYEDLIGAMKRAEAKMDPVLDAFRDQVLFLKHNLNARAISSLEDELTSVENGVAALIADMEASIREADTFIQSINTDS